jgi:hypothetical protein
MQLPASKQFEGLRSLLTGKALTLQQTQQQQPQYQQEQLDTP